MMRRFLASLLITLLVSGALLAWQVHRVRQERKRDLERAEEADRRRKEMELARIEARKTKTVVVRPNVYLPAGGRILETAVRYETIDRRLAPAGAAASLEEVIGKYAAETLPKDDVVNRRRLSPGPFHPERAPEWAGKCFQVLRVPGRQAVSGFVKAGDTVDLLATRNVSGTLACWPVVAGAVVFSVNGVRRETTAEEAQTGSLEPAELVLVLERGQARCVLELAGRGASFTLALGSPGRPDAIPSHGWTSDLLLADRGARGHPEGVGPALLGSSRGHLRRLTCSDPPAPAGVATTAPTRSLELDARGDDAKPGATPGAGGGPR